MFSSTTSINPNAEVTASISKEFPSMFCKTFSDNDFFSLIDPPAKFSGSNLPKTRSASVTAGLSPPLLKHAGPGSDPALSGPTRICFILSTYASEPPPAPISTISITGIEIGIPEPFLNRYVLATSNTLEVFGV